MSSENAIRDQNFVTGRLAVLNTDTVQGTNKVRIKVSDDGAMLISSSDSINFTMVPIDPQDENFVNCMTFEGTDGQIYPWVANSDGAVLISS